MHWIDRVLHPSLLRRLTEALKQSGACMIKKRAQILSAIGLFNRPVTAEAIRKPGEGTSAPDEGAESPVDAEEAKCQ